MPPQVAPGTNRLAVIRTAPRALHRPVEVQVHGGRTAEAALDLQLPRPHNLARPGLTGVVSHEG